MPAWGGPDTNVSGWVKDNETNTGSSSIQSEKVRHQLVADQ